MLLGDGGKRQPGDGGGWVTRLLEATGERILGQRRTRLVSSTGGRKGRLQLEAGTTTDRRGGNKQHHEETLKIHTAQALQTLR